MKKIVTCLVTVLLFVALGTTVFANSPSYLDSSQVLSLPRLPQVEHTYVESTIDGFQGETINTIADMDAKSNNTATGVLVGEIALSDGNFIKTTTDSTVFLLDLSASDKNAKGEITFGMHNPNSSFMVLHYTTTAWEVAATGVSNAKGEGTATVTGFSPYMILTNASTVPPEIKPTPPPEVKPIPPEVKPIPPEVKLTPGNQVKKSPQTGLR